MGPILNLVCQYYWQYRMQLPVLHDSTDYNLLHSLGFYTVHKTQGNSKKCHNSKSWWKVRRVLFKSKPKHKVQSGRKRTYHSYYPGTRVCTMRLKKKLEVWQVHLYDMLHMEKSNAESFYKKKNICLCRNNSNRYLIFVPGVNEAIVDFSDYYSSLNLINPAYNAVNCPVIIDFEGKKDSMCRRYQLQVIKILH